MIRLIKSMLLPAGIATSLSVQAVLTKPNIIVFIADDLGWEDLEPYGNNKIQTPNINKLAKEGCRFDKVFLTASSSSPSRASILTALYPSETGASELHQPLSAGQIVASTPLRNIGYYTVSAGKWHLGDVKDQWDQVETVPGNSAHKIGDIWINAIQHVPENKPFFIWAAANDPHRPYDEITPKVNNPDSLILPTYLPDLSVVRKDYADYYNEISRFDTHVGMAVNELKRLGLYENTIIVIMSDNGSPMPTAKTRTNLQGMKTPLIIVNAARIQPNTCNRALISSIDIMPTLLEWAGTQYPNAVSGISFADICHDNKQIFREYAFAEHNWHDFMAYERAIYSDSLILNVNYLPHLPANPPNDVVKSKAYQVFRQAFENGELNGKYQETFYSPRSEYELWNYEKDPHCTVNEVKNKDFSEQFKKMNRTLKTHLKQTRSYRDIKYLTKDKYDRKTGALIK